MKIRLIVALALIAALLGVAVNASAAGRPPASWDRATCPYPYQGEPPSCFFTPRPAPGPTPEVEP